MNFLVQLITWINVPVNATGKFLLAPVAILPGWLSNTIISAVTGVLLLFIFKYTSNQKAIAGVRDDIKAHMLALKLFKDSISVTLRAQGRVFRGAFLLLFYAIVPMLVMIVPVTLLLGQMGVWYQARPLMMGEEAVVVVSLNDSTAGNLSKVSIASMPGAEVSIGPVKVPSKSQVYWKIKAVEKVEEGITFEVDGQKFEKQLATGKGFIRLSAKRPGANFAEIMLHPIEQPFAADSVVKSISIDYPQRESCTSGTDWWLIYFFVASMVFALVFKPFLKVKI